MRFSCIFVTKDFAYADLAHADFSKTKNAQDKDQVYKNIFVPFLVQMKTLKSPFEIN